MIVKKTSKPTAASPKRSPPRRPPRRASIAPAAFDPIVAFAGVAKRERVRWYLFGAQAVAAHGVPRSTDDIDITIELGSRPLEDLIAPLRRAGFVPRIADVAFIRETRVLPVHHRPTGWNVDLVLAGPGIEERFLAEAQMFRVGKLDIPVLAAEHLAALKVLAGRPKDLEDVRGLVRIADLDHSRVTEILVLLERSLDQSDLLPLYERLRVEARSR